MRTPDPQLMEIYGTDKLASKTNSRDMVLAAQVAAAILGMSLMNADRSHVANQELEAQRLNDVARGDEARRMEAMVNAMKMAKSAGAAMASMNKEAFGGTLASKLIPAVKGALTPGWKAKTLATAGTLGAGYAGYKGLSAIRDRATARTAPGAPTQFGSRTRLAHNVNEFGQPE